MITILTVGKTKQDWIIKGIEEYNKRLSKFTKISWKTVSDIKLTPSINKSIVKEKEGEIILKKLKNYSSYKVLLDENGKNLSSVEFADFISKKNFDITFIIGGVYGVAEKVKDRADMLLSFSKMTFTHQMIRLILAEQIYRAFTILKEKKYHY